MLTFKLCRLKELPPSLAPKMSFNADVHPMDMVLEICDVLQELCIAKFEVGGFGQHSWPVDVRTDLAVFIEQLPDSINCCNEGSRVEFEIDFYEQGVERCLAFEPRDKEWKVVCRSCTDWTPLPKYETVPFSKLSEMLSEIRGTFLELASATLSEPMHRQRVRNWLTGCDPLRDAK